MQTGLQIGLVTVYAVIFFILVYNGFKLSLDPASIEIETLFTVAETSRNISLLASIGALIIAGQSGLEDGEHFAQTLSGSLVFAFIGLLLALSLEVLAHVANRVRERQPAKVPAVSGDDAGPAPVTEARQTSEAAPPLEDAAPIAAPPNDRIAAAECLQAPANPVRLALPPPEPAPATLALPAEINV